MKQSRMKWSRISGAMDFGIWSHLCMFGIGKEREIESVEWESTAAVKRGRDEHFGNASSQPGRVCRFASAKVSRPPALQVMPGIGTWRTGFLALSLVRRCKVVVE